jgi:hypothetical protein
VLAQVFPSLVFSHLKFCQYGQIGLVPLPAITAPTPLHVIFAVSFGVMAMSVFPPSAFAEEWFMTPSLRLSYEQNDNIRMTLQPHKTVHGSIIAPRVDLGVQSEIWGITGSAEIARKRYSGEPDLNRDFETFRLSSLYKTERNSFLLDASRVNDAAISGELVDPDIGRTTTQKSRRTESVQPMWRWSITERAQIQLGYQLSEASYVDGESVGLYDYRNRTATATWSYMLSPRSQFFFTASNSRFRVPEVSLESQIPSVSQNFTAIHRVNSRTPSYRVGIGHTFSATMSGTIMVGRRKTSTDREVFNCAPFTPTLYQCIFNLTETHDTGTTFSGDLRKEFEKFSISAKLSRDIAASGLGTEVEWDTLNIQIDRPFTARLKGTLTASANNSRHLADADVSNVDMKYYYIQPALQWFWTREANLSLAYRYNHLKQEDEDQAAQSRAIYLSLVYTWAKYSISR